MIKMVLDCSKTLQKGSKNKNVYALQVVLRNKGYYTGLLDSSYGTLTREAVKRLQRKLGVTVDGIFGKQTCTAYNNTIKKIVKPAVTSSTNKNNVTDTGYKQFNKIIQRTSYNKEKYATWARLPFVRDDELNKYGKQWDLSGVAYNISSSKKSALLYMSDFGFNIPNDATITKVVVRAIYCQDNIQKDRIRTHLVKLKIGASTNDLGKGYNKSDDKLWKTQKYCHIHGMDSSTYGESTNSVKDTWNVDLTPSIVNSKDFGVIFQVKGSGTTKHKIYLDAVEMKICYTNNKAKTDNTDPEYNQHLNYDLTYKKEDTLTGKLIATNNCKCIIENKSKYLLNKPNAVNTIAYDNPTPINFWLRVQNNVYTPSGGKSKLCGGYTVPVYFKTDGNLVFSGNKTEKVFSKHKLNQNTDSKYLTKGYEWYYYNFNVYSNITNLEDTIDCKIVAYTCKLNNKNKWIPDIKNGWIGKIIFTLDEGYTNIPYSQTILTNCSFSDNHSNRGAAIYNSGRLYVKNIKLNNNKTHPDIHMSIQPSDSYIEHDTHYILDKEDKCQFWDVERCRDVEFKQ